MCRADENPKFSLNKKSRILNKQNKKRIFNGYFLLGTQIFQTDYSATFTCFKCLNSLTSISFMINLTWLDKRLIKCIESWLLRI